MNETLDRERLELERERLRHEIRLRESDQVLKEAELKKSGWTSPAVLALAAAAIGLTGNAIVALINGRIEDRKAEYNRVLEMIKVGDPDKAAENLTMLLESGLYHDPNDKLASYLRRRTDGAGASLPIPGDLRNTMSPRVAVDQELLQYLQQKDNTDAPWMALAIGEVGYTRISGPRSNSRIEEYLASTNISGDDEIPWASAFVNWVFTRFNMGGTGSARAADWQSWGTALAEPRYGAVVVFEPLTHGSSGHVGFFVDAIDGKVRVLGGNQRAYDMTDPAKPVDAVAVNTFPRSRIRSVRWPCPPPGCE